jgi:hypothetical protein
MTKARDLANASTALSAVSATELAFVDGVTSAIQTQLDAKATLTGTETFTNKTLTSPVLTTPTISTVNAKGDLLAGTADNTVDRLAVGNNGETLVADSAASTGLSYQANWAAGKNKIINGDFNINQRAFTSTTTSGPYTFDRWKTSASGGTVTWSAQAFTPGAAPVAGYESKNFMRIATTGQSGSSEWSMITQSIEDVRILAGQTATISFWAKAASGTPKVAVEVQQSFGSGGSPSSNTFTYGGQATISTSWARYSVTFTVPSISGKTIGTTENTSYLFLALWASAGSALNARTGSIGIQNNTIDFWGVQVEAGSVATAFQTATGTIQGELAACQRYYVRWTGSASYPRFATKGVSLSATNVYFYVDHPVEMRVAPTAIEFSTLAAFNFTPNVYALSALILDNCNTKISSLYGTTSGMTSNQFMVLVGNNTSSGFLGLSSEL